jgi:hypothetical protein
MIGQKDAPEMRTLLTLYPCVTFITNRSDPEVTSMDISGTRPVDPRKTSVNIAWIFGSGMKCESLHWEGISHEATGKEVTQEIN